MGNKNRRSPKPEPSASAETLQRITDLRKAIEIEQRLERKEQHAILSEILKRHGYDIPPGEAYRLLAIRRESVSMTGYRVDGMRKEVAA